MSLDEVREAAEEAHFEVVDDLLAEDDTRIAEDLSERGGQKWEMKAES